MKAIKQKVNSLTPQWFMSHDADQFFYAFRVVFGSTGTKKILCAWHIDRSWRRALKQHRGNDRRIEIYHYLRVILMESDPAAFLVQLQQFLTFFDENNENNFLQYFRNNY